MGKTADELNKESIRTFYDGWSSEEILEDGMKYLVKACPPEERGEDEDCVAIQDILHEQHYRIVELREAEKRLRQSIELIVEWLPSISQEQLPGYLKTLIEK